MGILLAIGTVGSKLELSMLENSKAVESAMLWGCSSLELWMELRSADLLVATLLGCQR